MDVERIGGNVECYTGSPLLYYNNEEIVGGQSPIAPLYTDEEKAESGLLSSSASSSSSSPSSTASSPSSSPPSSSPSSAVGNLYESGIQTVPEGGGDDGSSRTSQIGNILRGLNHNQSLEDASIFYSTYLIGDQATPGSSSTSSHIDSSYLESTGDSPQQLIHLDQTLPSEQNSFEIARDSGYYIAYDGANRVNIFECEGNQDFLIETKCDKNNVTLTEEPGQRDLNDESKDNIQSFASDVRTPMYLLNESFSNEIQEKILMEDKNRSSELVDPHIPIEKFSEKMQYELITGMNRGSSDDCLFLEFTNIKNNQREDMINGEDADDEMLKLDDFINDNYYSQLSNNLPDDLFQPNANNSSFTEGFSSENFMESSSFPSICSNFLPNDNNSSDRVKTLSPIKQPVVPLKIKEFAKISENCELLNFDIRDKSAINISSENSQSISPTKSVLEERVNSDIDEIEADFEGFEVESDQDSENLSLSGNKQVAIVKAMNSVEYNESSYSSASFIESDDSNEENVSPDSSELCSVVQVHDVSSSGNVGDRMVEEKKVLTKSKNENRTVSERRDLVKLRRLKENQRIRDSIPDDIIEKLKVSCNRKRSGTKILEEALLPKYIRRKCLTQTKKKIKGKKKNLKNQVEARKKHLHSKGNNQVRPLPMNSPDHTYCKTPEKKKIAMKSYDNMVKQEDTIYNKLPDYCLKEKETLKTLNETDKYENLVKIEPSEDEQNFALSEISEERVYTKLPEYCQSVTNSLAPQLQHDVEIDMNKEIKVEVCSDNSDEQRPYTKIPEYCQLASSCQSPQLQQDVDITMNKEIKVEACSNNHDSQLTVVKSESEQKNKSLEVNVSSQIKEENIKEAGVKEIDGVYSRLPDYVTDVANVKTKVELPGVVFETVRPQENIESQQSEGCKKKKKLNLLEYRMRKMNSAENSRCCSPNVTVNNVEGKIIDIVGQISNNSEFISRKTSEDREDGEIKEELESSAKISQVKNCPSKLKNSEEHSDISKKAKLSPCNKRERKSQSHKQRQIQSSKRKKPTVIEIDLVAEEEEKKREEKIRAKLGLISNLNMPSTSLGHSLLHPTKNSSETNQNNKYSSSSISSSSRRNSKKRHYELISSSRSRSRSKSYSSKESFHRRRSKDRSKRTSSHRKSERRLSRSRSRSVSTYTSLSCLSSSSSRSRSRSRTRTKSKSKSYSKYRHHRSKSRSKSRSRRRIRNYKKTSHTSTLSKRGPSPSRTSSSNWEGMSRYGTYHSNAYYDAYSSSTSAAYGLYNGYDDYVEDHPSYNRREREEERRVIHVGGIAEGTTKDDLRNRFSRFGDIIGVSLHFRDTGDNYGFVNFRSKEAAYAAYDYGQRNPHLTYKVSFGNRRNFCTEYYSDLDAQHDQEKYYSSAYDMDYDTLLQAHKRDRR